MKTRTFNEIKKESKPFKEEDLEVFSDSDEWFNDILDINRINENLPELYAVECVYKK